MLDADTDRADLELRLISLAHRTMVGGNSVVTDGAIAGLDVADLIRRHSAAAKAMQAD